MVTIGVGFDVRAVHHQFRAKPGQKLVQFRYQTLKAFLQQFLVAHQLVQESSQSVLSGDVLSTGKAADYPDVFLLE